MSITRVDLALLATAAGAVATSAWVSARAGAIALGMVFLLAGLLRQRGIASLLLVQRRQRTDVLVLAAFGVTLIALALVLP